MAAPSTLRLSSTLIQSAFDSVIDCEGSRGDGTTRVRVERVDEVMINVEAASEGDRERTEAVHDGKVSPLP